MKGNKAVGQYFPPVRDLFDNLATCPEEFLLWFHRCAWDYKLKSGKTLWNGLCEKYQEGARQAAAMQTTWQSLAGADRPATPQGSRRPARDSGRRRHDVERPDPAVLPDVQQAAGSVNSKLNESVQALGFGLVRKTLDHMLDALARAESLEPRAVTDRAAVAFGVAK